MSDVTVTQFAEVLKVPVEKLLTQLDQAGIKVAGALSMTPKPTMPPMTSPAPSRMEPIVTCRNRGYLWSAERQ